MGNLSLLPEGHDCSCTQKSVRGRLVADATRIGDELELQAAARVE